MADNDIIRQADLTRDEIISANLARLGVTKTPVSKSDMQERVFKKAVELARENGELASSVDLSNALKLSQSKVHTHLQELARAGRMVPIGSGSRIRYMPVVD